MKAEDKRVCQVCGTPFPATSDFCPVCALRGAIADDQATGELAADPTASPSELRFGHYQVLTREDGKPFELGRGAMGVTYKAFDVDLQCPAALKVINARYLGDESARLRFVREARAAASVRHPNVASVFHLGKSGGNYFYAMEFVEGETLEHLIKRAGRLEVRLALDIGAQVAAGLAAVNKQKLVHRDIKPSNIMVCLEEGGAPTVKIIDLGLAKPLSDSSSQAGISVPGAFVGTPAFASPEQFVGSGVDIRSDLYSLGVVLWQMLVGQTPFRGSSNEVRNQHQHAALPLEELRNVPQQAIPLIQVLLQKDPARRFQTPAELLMVLPMVKDAIETGRRIMKTIRVFVSSTGDVQKERNLANRVIRSIAAELDLSVRDSDSNFQRLAEANAKPANDAAETEPENDGELILCPFFWEYQSSRPGRGYHGEIPNTGRFDLVLSIVWSRLGYPVAPILTMPDGSPPDSGTDYEVAWALDRASKGGGVPVLRVYRNCSKPTPPLEPKEEREAFGQQWDSVQDFFVHWEKSSEGGLAGKVDNYHSLEEFEELFRERFRDFLAGQLEHEVRGRISGRKVRRWKSSPFRGLNVFDFEHAPIFYGRTKAVGEVLEALEEQLRAQRPFVLVVGASGSGKSSLVRAGVLPLLTQPGTIEGIGLWRWAVTRPGAGGSAGDCFDALAAALLEPAALPALEDLESLSAVRDLASELRDHSDAVALRVRDALDHAAREWKIRQSHYLQERERQLRSSDRSDEANLVRQQTEALEPPKTRLVLVVDQLEELFTSGFSPDLRQKYISAIAGLVRSGRVFILAALRSDFYSSYQEFPELIELTRPSGKIDLRPPTAYEIGSMIRLPAEAAGLRFEQDRTTGQRLDEALRDAAAATPESLPLLEHVLSLLYDLQVSRGDHLLRWSDYRELGELKGALAKHAETVFGTLQPDEQKAFPLVMRYLVTLGQGEEEVPNRRTVPYRDFVAVESTSHDQKSGAKGFVDLFIEQRLLVADTDPQGQVTVSVTHEALLREWQRIKEWLTENREFLRMRDRLDSSLKLWLSRGKQKDDLLGPGLPLAEGEKLVKDFSSSLSRGQNDYVSASITEQKRRQRIRERIRYGVMAGITAALVVAIIFGVVSFLQYRRAERAKVAANRAAQRASQARDEAQKLISFMTIDLRDKLKPIGRLDPLKDVALRVLAYYENLVGDDKSPKIRRQQSIALLNYGDILKDQGDLVGALKSYRDALAVQKPLTNQDPKNAEWQRDLSVSLEKVALVLRAQGSIDGALANYRESLQIREELAHQNPSNAAFQLDLSAILERIGDVLNDQGNVDGALEQYQKSLPIHEKLADQDPSNVALQLGLSWSRADIGDMLGIQGDSGGALRNYRSALLIRQKLVNQDPSNADLQHHLSICFAQIGHAWSAQGSLKEALDAYRQALTLMQPLAAKDPSNTWWKRDYSISLERVGDVLKTLGQYPDALESYTVSLSIRRELLSKDGTNSLWQSDVSWSYQEIGDVLMAQKKFQEALQNYQESLAIAERLAKVDPTNDEWQSDLAIIREKTGEVFAAQGKSAEALQEFRDSLSICEKLTQADPKNAERAADEALALFQVGVTLSRTEMSSGSEVRTMLIRARDILLNLKQRSTLSALNQSRLEEIQAVLGNP
jgi:serine/threonine protein kinase/tetratricopeptide (TPR) repeat protein